MPEYDPEQLVKVAQEYLTTLDSDVHLDQIVAVVMTKLYPDLPMDAFKEVKHHTYYAIHGDMNRNGECSPFRKAGRAKFVIATNYDPTKHVVKRNKSTKSEEHEIDDKLEAAKRKKRGAEVVIERTCGNCSAMTYTGPHVLYLDSGACERGEETLRWYNASDAPACELWRRRTKSQVSRDECDQNAAQVFVDKFNSGNLGSRKIKRERS